MGKLALLLSFILVLNVVKSQSQVDATEQIYDYIIVFLKGMALTDRYECANLFIDHKNELLTHIKEMSGNQFDLNLLSSLASLANDLLTIKGIYEKCNVGSFLRYLMGLNSDYQIRDIGDRITANAVKIFEYITGANTLDEKLMAAGHIFSIITNLYVY